MKQGNTLGDNLVNKEGGADQHEITDVKLILPKNQTSLVSSQAISLVQLLYAVLLCEIIRLNY